MKLNATNTWNCNHYLTSLLHCMVSVSHAWILFVPRCWTWPRHSRMGRVPSSWCRCHGWWWNVAAQAGRDAWSRWATPLRKLSTANGPFSPLGSPRTVMKGSWGETSEMVSFLSWKMEMRKSGNEGYKNPECHTGNCLYLSRGRLGW